MSRSLGLFILLRNGKPPSGVRLGTRLFSNVADVPTLRPAKSRFLKPRQGTSRLSAEAAEESSRAVPSDSLSRTEAEGPKVQSTSPAVPAVPPPPPPPPSGATTPPPGEPQVPTRTAAAASTAPRSVAAARTQAPTLSAEQQYARLKAWLPETKEPNTVRPTPDQLKVGAQLRVEWSSAWWRASVKQEAEGKVKVGFDTWSSKYDEWIPLDSQRLRMPLPEDQDAAPQEVGEQAAEQLKPVGSKPYDPEQEFEKRQRRLKARIAQSRQHVHGTTSSEPAPAEAAAPSASVPKPAISDPMADLTKAHHVRQMKLREKIAGLQQERLGQVDEAVSSVLAEASSPPTSGGESHPQQQATVPPSVPSTPLPPPPSAPPTAPPPSAPPVSAPPVSAPPATSPPQQASSAQSDPAGQPQAATPSTAAKESSSSSSQQAETSPEAGQGLPPMPPLQKQDIPDGVRWMELQTESKEYYYYEVSSGRTQWDLPSLGWVQLRDADGAPYYWLPEDNITQWTPPA